LAFAGEKARWSAEDGEEAIGGGIFWAATALGLDTGNLSSADAFGIAIEGGRDSDDLMCGVQQLLGGEAAGEDVGVIDLILEIGVVGLGRKLIRLRVHDEANEV